MNLKSKIMLMVLLLVAALAAGCSQEATPYEINNAEGYSISVKFDANGGYFGTNTTVIVDSYNPQEAPSAGIALLPPDDERRGIDAYDAQNPGYFLAGWYAERTETENGYTYSRKWNFETDRLTVDQGAGYSADEPVMTLYAVWIPKFTVNFYDRASGQLLDTAQINPDQADEILVPQWDEKTGTIEMYDFPQREGYTFATAYYDAEGKLPVDTPAVNHPGTVNESTGQAENANLDVYLDWTEGEWYRIYNVEQFLDNASVSGNYEILADLDFEGEIWPTSLMHGNFSGVILGNGHTFSNITVVQTNNAKSNTGLFGALTETSQLRDVRFENVSMTIKGGTRVAGSSFGLLAGTISGQAELTNVKIENSFLQIDASAYFGTDDYVIGLVCGMGSVDIPHEIQVAVVGEGLYANVNADGTVSVGTEPFAEAQQPAEESQPAA